MIGCSNKQLIQNDAITKSVIGKSLNIDYRLGYFIVIRIGRNWSLLRELVYALNILRELVYVVLYVGLRII